ncbi:MAG: hypothetical protein IKX40_11020 [Thermoguttaceae bacterium]|nr:hypothetical protein [Thermoguttaceae bacterium]
MFLIDENIVSSIVNLPPEEALKVIGDILEGSHNLKLSGVRECRSLIERGIRERRKRTETDPECPIYRNWDICTDPDSKGLQERQCAFDACVRAAYRSGRFSETDFNRAIHDGFYNYAHPYPYNKRPSSNTMAGLCKAHEAYVAYLDCKERFNRQDDIKEFINGYRPC